MNGLPSSLIPFSDLIWGVGDFLAKGNFLGTSCKCDGILLLSLCSLLADAPDCPKFCEFEFCEFVELLLATPNSCLTTTGGSTVLFVITFLDGCWFCCCCWTVVEFVEELLVFPGKKQQKTLKYYSICLEKNNKIGKLFNLLKKSSEGRPRITRILLHKIHVHKLKLLQSDWSNENSLNYAIHLYSKSEKTQ